MCAGIDDFFERVHAGYSRDELAVRHQCSELGVEFTNLRGRPMTKLPYKTQAMQHDALSKHQIKVDFTALVRH